MKLFELTLEGYKFNRKLKNIILKSISYIMFFIGSFGAMGLDSNFNICMAMFIISMCWLVPYGIVNRVIKL